MKTMHGDNKNAKSCFCNNNAWSLTQQPWSNIGLGCGYVSATSDKDKMVHQITSILEYRLIDIVLSKKQQQQRQRRQGQNNNKKIRFSINNNNDNLNNNNHEHRNHPDDKLVDESNSHNESLELSLISQSVRRQICHYVSRIGSLYRKKHYHNLEHACHVTISVNKLVNMIFDGDDNNLNHYERCFFCDSGSTLATNTQKKKSRLLSSSNSPSKINVTSAKKISFQLTSSSPFTKKKSSDSPHDKKSKSSKRSYDSLINDTHNKSSPGGVDMDALTKFAFILGALVHDVDHLGVSNRQLENENHALSKRYKKSIAEFHSLNLALNTMMEPSFDELRRTIMPSPEDKLKFRRTITDVLLGTDIASMERAIEAKGNWDRVFGLERGRRRKGGEEMWPSKMGSGCRRRNSLGSSEGGYFRSIMEAQMLSREGEVKRRTSHGMLALDEYYYEPLIKEEEEEELPHETTTMMMMSPADEKTTTTTRLFMQKKRMNFVNGDSIDYYQKRVEYGGLDRLKTTVVLETLMNAADIAHTMQSWDNFLKWNAKLFAELHEAYLDGRGNDDPSKNWCKDQISFFDNYVLPLTRRVMRCCGGCSAAVGGEEEDYGQFFRNARDNRRRWLDEGMEVTRKMIARVVKNR